MGIKKFYLKRIQRKQKFGVENWGRSNAISVKKSYSKLFNRIKGLKLIIYGENNVIEFDNDVRFINSRIVINGNNANFIIGKNSNISNANITIDGDNVNFKIGKDAYFESLYSVISGCNTANNINVDIGDNCSFGANMRIFAGGWENNNLIIGDNCMCSRDVSIYTHDGHNIFDKNNYAKNSISIGNNVWLGHGSYIAKNTCLNDDTIVGAKSFVNKQFEQRNIIIAGNPAKIIKKNVYFKQ